MVVLSVLRGAVQSSVRAVQPSLLRSGRQEVRKFGIRQKSDDRIQILPSKYEFQKWKDDVHFYFLLGIIPLGGLVLYVNIFIGNAELADIPEGYEPKPWEYHKNPIRRWMAQYVYDPPEKIYEKTLHHLDETQTRAKFNLLERKARRLMSENRDYKGWYYLPTHEREVLSARHRFNEVEAGKGTS